MNRNTFFAHSVKLPRGYTLGMTSARSTVPDNENGYRQVLGSRPEGTQGHESTPRPFGSADWNVQERKTSKNGPSSSYFLYPPNTSEVLRRTRSPGKGFCVLCLDGGGCRGYISLLTLRHLLKQLQPDGPIYPYLYFDLICGTSTGGLIAILLAVLHVEIDTAIAIYRDLMGQVFSNGFSILRYLRKDAGCSRQPFERAVVKTIEGYGGGRTLMEDPCHERGCRAFITTAHCVKGRRSVLAVRSYRPPGGIPTIPNGHQWTCRDAALAAAAAPTFFKPHLIFDGKTQFIFEDAGAHRTNNPTQFAFEECQRLDAKDSQLNASNGSLFISLGTGTRGGASDPEVRNRFRLFQNKLDALRASTRYATDVKEVHKWMKGKAEHNDMSYFRLNPPLGHKIGLGDWEEVPAMEESVVQYCDRKRYKTRIQDCVDKLDQFQAAERRKSGTEPL